MLFVLFTVVIFLPPAVDEITRLVLRFLFTFIFSILVSSFVLVTGDELILMTLPRDGAVLVLILFRDSEDVVVFEVLLTANADIFLVTSIDFCFIGDFLSVLLTFPSRSMMLGLRFPLPANIPSVSTSTVVSAAFFNTKKNKKTTFLTASKKCETGLEHDMQ